MEAALNSPLGRIVLGPQTFRLGRAADNTLVIQDQQSSSRHAEITLSAGGNGYQVTDLGSTNGTFVNEQRLTPHSPRVLNSGDVIRIGQTKLTYEMSAGYAPTMAASAPNFEPTVAAAQPDFYTPPVTPQPSAYGNFNTPAQPPYTPPAYPQQAAYPEPQPVYPQPAYPQAQPGYPQPAYPQPGFQQPGAFGQPGFQQPGAFGQPGFPPPGGFPPPQKKSKAGLIIALVVILVVLVGGGGGFYYFQLRSTPQKTVQNFCTALEHNDAQGVYDSYSSEAQALTSVSKIQTGLQALTLVTGGITNCTVNSVQENGSTATVNVTLTPARGQSATGDFQLINENGTWKIQNNRSVL